VTLPDNQIPAEIQAQLEAATKGGVPGVDAVPAAPANPTLQPEPQSEPAAAPQGGEGAEKMIPQSVFEKRAERFSAKNRKLHEEKGALEKELRELRAQKRIADNQQALAELETPDGFDDMSTKDQIAYMLSQQSKLQPSSSDEENQRLREEIQELRFQQETAGLTASQRELFLEVKEETGMTDHRDLLAIAQARHPEEFGDVRVGESQHYQTNPGRQDRNPPPVVPASQQIEEAMRKDRSRGNVLGPLLQKARRIEAQGGNLSQEELALIR
jgi:hypothetical protein